MDRDLRDARTPLDTPRLRLRAPRAGDAPAFDALLAEAGRPAAGADWIAAEAEAARRPGACRLAIELRASRQVIGHCGLVPGPARRRPREAELELRLLSRHRGFGRGREAAGALLIHGFLALGLDRIIARLPLGDAAAIRALEAVGLRFERLETPAGAHPLQLYALNRPA